MSSALTAAARLKPEIRLAQAVSEFEADLSMEQKVRFNSSRSQALKQSPEIQDVMRFTAEIDRQVSFKIGRGRCYGPRLTSFLQSVQQFVGLGDIVVGGSQNLIACGVWSLVRMSLMSIVQTASHLEKISKLFMAIGRSAPRYLSMADIYPRSRELQAYLCEYFIVVVRLCHQVLRFTQKSAVMQFTSSLNSSSLDSYQPQLEMWATAIKEEVNLLMVKRTEDEANKNSKFRDWSIKSWSLDSRQKKLAAIRKVLNLCSTYDYQVKWKQARKKGNSTVFQTDPKYQDWKASRQSATLLYTGRLGSGKSVLMANIVDDFNLENSDDCSVAYFFCRHDEAESLQTKTIIGSLTRQLLLSVKDTAIDFGKFDEDNLEDADSIVELLQKTFPRNRRAMFVLDGLDECDQSVAKELIQYMERTQETLTLLLCVSLRQEPGNLLRYSPEQFVRCYVTSVPVNNPDIESFIDRELESRLQSKQLVIGSPELILEIRESLIRGSQGMFLWVALQIDILCTMRTDGSIRQALVDLPGDLSETFSRILKKHQSNTVPNQRSVLEVVMVVQRPLSTEELREALSVTHGDTNWDLLKLINDVNLTLACCGSLVTVDEEDSTVQFIHHSVKQYLLKEYLDSSGVGFDIDNANFNMARLILTYLCYSHLDTQVSNTVNRRINAASAPTNIIKSTIGSRNGVQDIALKLLRLKTGGNFDIGEVLQAVAVRREVQSTAGHHFLKYVKLYWIYHLCATSVMNIRELSRLHKILDRHIISIHEAVSLTQTDYYALMKSAGWPFKSKGRELTRRLVSQQQSLGRSVLFWASIRENIPLLQRLIRDDRIYPGPLNEQGQTPLICAAQAGCAQSVFVLLQSDLVYPNWKDDEGWTALMYACQEGHQRVVEILLSDRTANKTHRHFKDKRGMTPLMLAAKGNHAALLELLRSFDDDYSFWDSKDNEDRTALTHAALNGSADAVRVLLDVGVDASKSDNRGRTPLICAAISGSWKTVSQFNQGNTLSPIFYSRNAEDHEGRSALSYAVQFGTIEMVQLLLSEPLIDFNCKDKEFRSPLSYAAQYNSLDVVNLFLGRLKGASGYEADSLGQTPLAKSIIAGKEDVVEVLLEAGGLTIMPDKDGLTPWDRAQELGNQSIITLLRKYVQRLI